MGRFKVTSYSSIGSSFAHNESKFDTKKHLHYSYRPDV